MARPMPREAPVTRTARDVFSVGSVSFGTGRVNQSPPAAVHDLVDPPPAAPQRRRPPVLRPRVADGDAADRHVLRRHPERLPEGRDPVGLDPEEARRQALVDGGEQHQQRGHPGVDVPVRHRPAGLVAVGGPLVRLGVAVEVGLLVRQRDDQQRRPAHPPEPVVPGRGLLRGGRGLPEQVPLLRRLQHQERPALAEAGRGCPDGVLEQPLADLGRDRPVGVVVADHVPLADHVAELHGPTLPQPFAGRCRSLPRLGPCRSCSCSPPSTSPTVSPSAWCRARPAARPPTATRSRRRWPGSATAPSGCTWSTWTPPSAAAPTASCSPRSSARSTSTWSCPGASATTRRSPPPSPPAAGGSTSARRRWSPRSGARGPSPNTVTGSPSARTGAGPRSPPPGGPRGGGGRTRPPPPPR